MRGLGDKGSWLTVKRVLNAHPLRHGGDDPVRPDHLIPEDTMMDSQRNLLVIAFAVRVSFVI